MQIRTATGREIQPASKRWHSGMIIMEGKKEGASDGEIVARIERELFPGLKNKAADLFRWHMGANSSVPELIGGGMGGLRLRPRALQELDALRQLITPIPTPSE